MDPQKKQKLNQQQFDQSDQVEKISQVQTQEKQDSQIDREQMIPEYKQLIEYKNNLVKLDILIQIESNEEQLEELRGMKNDLEDAIQAQEQKIKKEQNNDYLIFNTEAVQKEHIGRLCKVFYEKELKWYHGVVTSVNSDDQIINVQIIGYRDNIQIDSVYVKLKPKPDPELFQPGFACEAIYSDDGKYYPCIIEKITEDGRYVVKFKKYNNKEELSLYMLRESRKNQQDHRKKRTFDDLTEFKVPDNLKYLPNESEQTRLMKKKKVKALKQQFKQAQLEKSSMEKQEKWKDFKSTAQMKKKEHFSGRTSKSIFQSPETIEGKVGVTNSGKGMTNFSVRSQQAMQDNSHLSRLF
ncbi:nucleic acid binding, putative [Ichthyophthirius multifiliis]|uniref:Survival of motor neuron-related-splicing factor 30 n=1 Tax=Ichthyophthirius multifiliis TaxID=5932 RepID=G0R147_ICHMU|nr:nucleic acid binding, putative [Ichthyophthirius multifiliis]EGR28814.1 nucleic acid binding, putative [Ichthyophthirius multifiliis]|eukprot:XP_004030050.1 nucleic acid binding, putative [Ichthyophthirius multifiliis]